MSSAEGFNNTGHIADLERIRGIGEVDLYSIDCEDNHLGDDGEVGEVDANGSERGWGSEVRDKNK